MIKKKKVIKEIIEDKDMKDWVVYVKIKGKNVEMKAKVGDMIWGNYAEKQQAFNLMEKFDNSLWLKQKYDINEPGKLTKKKLSKLKKRPIGKHYEVCWL